jgi:radical SAM protein with 4Fe4S-binding SPASM domain
MESSENGLSFKSYATQWFEYRYNFLPNRFYCQIHLLRACEYHCVHCYFREIPEGAKSRLSFSDTKSILDKMREAASKHGLNPRVDFTGGDPLLHPGFFTIAEYAVSHGIPFGIKGNPDLLRGKALRRLRELNVQEVTLSLEGLEPVHDGIRGKGSFGKTVETIGHLKDEGFTVRVHTTISKFNADQLLPLFNFLISNGFVIDDWTWSRFWSITDSADMLDRRQLVTVFHELTSVYEKAFSDRTFYFCNPNGQLIPKILVGFKEHLWFPFLVQEGYIEEQVASKIIELPNSVNCTATKHVYIVDIDGQVYKCRKIAGSSIGNILNETFDDMLGKDVAQRFIYLSRHSVCGSCQYFNGCGGCAAVAEAKRKSIWAGDADCFIEGAPSSKLGEFKCLSRSR